MSALPQTLALGLQAHRAGSLQQAKQIYLEILERDRDCADAWHLLGLLHFQLKHHHQAETCLRRAVMLDRLNPIFYSSLGLVYQTLEQFEEAVTAFKQSLLLQHEDAETHRNLGLTLMHLDRFGEAIASFEQALRLKPDYAEVCGNLGVALGRAGRFAEASTSFERALSLRPDYIEAYSNLGITLKELGRYDEAVACLEKSLQLQPHNALIHYNLGLILAEMEQLAAAQASFERAIRLDPSQTLWPLKLAGLCPSVMPDRPAIATWRTGFAAALAANPPGSLDLRRWAPQVITTNLYPPFHLPYHGLDDLPLKRQYAALFSLSEPPLEGGPPGQPYRLGFVVTVGHEGIFLNLMRGLIDQLDHNSFQPVIICAASGLGRLQSLLKNKAVEYLTIPQNLISAAEIIRAARFDLLYYWEVGSDALNYFLPFFRLAPVQCTSWGLSSTTGIPQMDYFISSELLEGPGAEAHYSERLIKLKTLPTYYYRPPLPEPLKTRQDFGLPGEAHLYLCPQNLLKFHPDFDPVLAEILRRDPLGRLLLPAAKNPAWTAALSRRFQETMPEVIERVEFFPQQSSPDFVNLMALADVMLDTFHYSGGNTSHEALAVGTPIVTYPSQFLRGRLALGRYRRMDLLICVAASPAAYVELALRLGTDPVYRAEIKAKILAANAVLYEDMGAVREMEDFFRQAIAGGKVRAA